MKLSDIDDIDAQWAIGSLKPNLYPRHVHVWRIFLPIKTEVKTCLQKTLSQDELLRIKKFRFEADRERMLVARGGLRDILARYLNAAATSVQFDYTEFGKPFLKQGTLNFNVSHSNNCILIAITDNMLVGIDVEYHKKLFNYLTI
jgi:4'-phosphopantetheinyl transferase